MARIYVLQLFRHLALWTATFPTFSASPVALQGVSRGIKVRHGVAKGFMGQMGLVGCGAGAGCGCGCGAGVGFGWGVVLAPGVGMALGVVLVLNAWM